MVDGNGELGLGVEYFQTQVIERGSPSMTGSHLHSFLGHR